MFAAPAGIALTAPIADQISQIHQPHYSPPRLMLADSPLVFSSPIPLAVALSMVVAMIGVAQFRGIAAGRWVQVLLATGALLLAFAAGQPLWNYAGKPSIVVMVDLSPSTRGATFRDRAALDVRIHQLLGDQPFELLAFADGNQSMPNDASLKDLPAERTRFSPPPADAIILFSDGQFELPANAPQTFPVIDPALDHPEDAEVTDLKLLGPQALATVTGIQAARKLHWTGALPDHPENSGKNFSQFATPIGKGEITASITPGDRWPENDELTIAPPPPVEQQKWWIGDAPAPPGWVGFASAEVPLDATAFLRASVIVLNNVPADSLPFGQQMHLAQYVRDLGGALVIVGGPQAFAAGGYDNTFLDQLSPLASSPPMPTMQWLLLIDGSGSMAGDPWKIEIDAITRLLPQLPAADTVSVGSFAETLSWWSIGKPAAQTSAQSHITPHGPTNLAAALNDIAAKSDGSMVSQLLLMTDADADLPHPTELATAFTEKKIHFHLLAIGQGSALPALRAIAASTGGSVIQQLDPAQWVSSANLLLRSAMPDHYQHRRINLTPGLPASISQWNQTWLKPDATAIQTSPDVPVVASWRRGLGQVTAIAYPAVTADVEKIADQIQQPPADPRFAVTWEAASTLRIKVDAVDHDQFMNALPISLEMRDPRTIGSSPLTMVIPQTGPGEYQLTMPSPRSPELLTVRNADRILRRFSIAGRYSAEFDAIGNNTENLRSLARRSGGKEIPPGPVKPLYVTGPTSQVSLAAEFAFAGCVAMAAGMVWYRHRR